MKEHDLTERAGLLCNDTSKSFHRGVEPEHHEEMLLASNSLFAHRRPLLGKEGLLLVFVVILDVALTNWPIICRRTATRNIEC